MSNYNLGLDTAGTQGKGGDLQFNEKKHNHTLHGPYCLAMHLVNTVLSSHDRKKAKIGHDKLLESLVREGRWLIENEPKY